MKVQIVIKQGNRKILKTTFTNGKRHDFRLFKESKTIVRKDQTVQVDTGYQGMQKIHNKVSIPKKRSKKDPLTKEDKKNNKEISKERITVENVLCMLKRFRILSDRYRNRRRRFGLRFNLIAGLYNYEL